MDKLMNYYDNFNHFHPLFPTFLHFFIKKGAKRLISTIDKVKKS